MNLSPQGQQMNTSTFFASIRSSIFGGKLAQTQVDGINALLGACTSCQITDSAQIAYVLATAYHETAATMQPIAEYGHGKGRPYGVPGRNHGQIPYGRGFCQITWDPNYEKTDAKLGLNGKLIANYDLLLTDVSMAAKAAVMGMRDGWYTSRKLSDYLTPPKIDFVNARRIINGTDKAALIAGYAQKFLVALEAS